MSTAAAKRTPSRRNGLPRVVIAACIALGVLLGAYTVITVLSLTTASIEHRTRDFAAHGALRIDAGSSDVTVVGERRGNVRVDMAIHRGMWQGGWQPRVATSQAGRRLRLQSPCSVWAHIGAGECGASFTVYVPQSTPLVVRTSSGDVRVADFRGRDASVRTRAGDVHVTALIAPTRLRASAGSGNVDIAVPDRAYRVVAETGSGDRSIGVRQDPASHRLLEATTSSGDLSISRLDDGR